MNHFCCSFCSFSSKFHSILLYHYSKDHENERDFRLTCQINGCLNQYSKVNSLRRHIARAHPEFCRKKPQHIGSSKHSQTSSADVNDPEHLNSLNEEQSSEQDKKNYFSELTSTQVHLPNFESISNFLMELREEKGVSSKNCNAVVTKFEEIIDGCIEGTEAALNRSNITDLDRECILEPLNCLKNSLNVINTTFKHEAHFKRKGFVAPVQHKLGNNHSLSYVPLHDQLKYILQHDDVLACILDTKSSNSDHISEFRDGDAFNSCEFLKSKNTLHIKLYMDDFQIINPLSNKANAHKICGFYWTLGNIPYKYTCKNFCIQLLALVKSLTIKKFGLATVLSQPIKDLKELESNGIEIIDRSGIVHHFFGTLSVVISDNLAAHEIGGFVQSFNSLRTCRFCTVTKQEMQTKFNPDDLVLRTPETYNEQVSIVKNNPALSVAYGLKQDSALNELNYFHVCWKCPSDIAHDIFEGFGLELIKVTIDHCLKFNYFNIDYLNTKISSFPYKGSDRTNRPVNLKSKSTKKVAVKQNALQALCLLRTLPLLVGHRIPESDNNWKIYTDFLDILDLVMAPSLSKGHIQVLSELTSQFLTDYYAMYEFLSVKPKAHYLLHYAKQYSSFGPLIHHSTLPFERKHSYFKNIMRRTKNFKSPCQTMAMKHQLMQSLHHKADNFLPDDRAQFRKIVKTEKVPLELQNYVNSHISIECSNFSFCLKADVNGISYSTDHSVLISANDMDHVYGKIAIIASVNGRVLLVVKLLKTLYFSTHHHAYVTVMTDEISAIYQENLESHVPIPTYQCSKFFLIRPLFSVT